ncbi:septation protein IspZ [Halieaceae bacterium IMCC14734]|uniref:Inner membrane-spanning protein YciB n=1 Tax=Candidatus Litorirhabdus singularis TaxID=2518993 RepID=A0ABT3TFU1_9GAMM|nr:septation protein IspZ [Candidatus Litorirhabdus singularis]MCX2981156.1 septation protein IspZ [Candidatus Litorirhabdus singularis]
MKQIAELVPLVLFFITYQMKGTELVLGSWNHTLDGIFSATAVLICATFLQVLLTWVITRKLEKRLLWMLAAVSVFGGATLIFRDQTFIFWKPTVFNWALALVFAGSHFIGERNLMERTLGGQIELPKPIWTRLLWLWIANFTVVGTLNIIVAYEMGEEFWVSYKLYSAIGFTLLLTLITALMVAPHLSNETVDAEADKPL